MGRVLIREGAVYALIIIVSALIVHPDLLSAPLERFARMTERGNYLHPLIYGGVLYLLVALVCRLVSFAGNVFRRKS